MVSPACGDAAPLIEFATSTNHRTGFQSAAPGPHPTAFGAGLRVSTPIKKIGRWQPAARSRSGCSQADHPATPIRPPESRSRWGEWSSRQPPQASKCRPPAGPHSKPHRAPRAPPPGGTQPRCKATDQHATTAMGFSQQMAPHLGRQATGDLTHPGASRGKVAVELEPFRRPPLWCRRRAGPLPTSGNGRPGADR